MSSPKPAVSVVIPAYNAGPYIAEAIRSVLAQTFEHWQLAVIDDGSTDDTSQVVQSFLADPRIRLWRKPRGGSSSARNVGISRTACDLVALLDADDFWLPEKLERQLEVMRAFPELGVCGCGHVLVSANGIVLDRVPLPAFHGMALPRLLFKPLADMSTAMIRRRVFEKVGLFDETLTLAEDYEFWLRVGTKYAFHIIPEPLSCYRRGHASKSNRPLSTGMAFVDVHILPRFLNEQGGRQFVKPWHLWRLNATRCKCRGDEATGRLARLGWYLRSILRYPFDIDAYSAVGATVVPGRLWRLVKALKERAAH